jgi:hypothetical protein
LSHPRRRALGACIAWLAAAGLYACGQKSALYLPQKKKTKVPPDPNNPEGSAPAAPAAEPSAAPSNESAPAPTAAAPPAA